MFDPTPDKDRVPESESHTKKNSPRPQVLQPPEPPEEPVELPPVSRDQDVAAKEPPPAGVPWLLIGTTAGSLILLILPFVLIVALKARRTRVRRKASPRVALVGSWDEVVDMALDAGVRVRADQTRQETAWALASFWKLREGQDAESAGDQPEGAQASGSDLIPGWTMFRESVPMTVAIAVVRRYRMIVFMPMRPSFEMSPRLVMPTTREKKTIGTMIILIRLMKMVPIGAIHQSMKGSASGPAISPITTERMRASRILIDRFMECIIPLFYSVTVVHHCTSF